MTVWHRSPLDAGRARRSVPVKRGAIVAGFDVHRSQITFDALDTETGEVVRGRIALTPAAVEEWVARFPGRAVHVAVEACTGWLFVARALERAGAITHLAEPVETSAARPQAAGEDRPSGRRLAAAIVGRGQAAGVMAAARARPPVALPRPAAKHAFPGAHQLGAADPRDALSPRHYHHA